MRCWWKRPSRDTLTGYLKSDDGDLQYLAALVLGTKFLDQKYDPNDMSDPGNRNYLSDPSAPIHEQKIGGGILTIRYTHVLGQNASLHILLKKSRTMTSYSATFSESSLELYTCECCINRSRGIMQAMAEYKNGEYDAVASLSVLKGKIEMKFYIDVDFAPRMRLTVELPKMRPMKTIAYAR
jgi:hypothetical protein